MNAFPTKILLATDGSADAALAATAAADVVSRGTGSELHVVHVLPHLPRYAYSGVTAPDVYSYVLDKTQEQARLLLDEQVRHIEERGGTVVETHTRRGRFVDEILDLAEEIGAGLILMGSRGLGSVKRLLLGSVAEGIVQNAHCPVLVARGGQEAWPPERVVIGHDGSEAARGAGEFAASIGRLFGARGLLVQVYPRLLEVDIEGREINARLIDDELRREERDLQARATQVEEHLGKRPKIRIATVGDPASVLLEAAEEEAPEKSLLAVGSRSLGPWKRMGLGSVSTKVLRAARGPVLVYPRPRTKSTSTDDSDTARAVAGNKVGRATAREETALVEALLRPEAYSWRPAAVELVETHISWVFLAGDRVVKVKKPVNYGFIDHTTLESRHQSCTDEVWLNRRLTDEVYLDVAPIVRDSAGDYHVAAEGAPVEWATLMRRLPEEGMLDALLATGAIPPRLGDRLANRLIPFHRNIAPPCRGPAEEVAAASSTAVTENLTELEPFAGRPLSP
ncbi:MAG: universal stress protein, partial [Rubrobacter sp.]